MHTVTGISTSRLSELRKFSVSGTIDKRYFTATSPASNGVNTGLTNENSIWVYYIDSITYVDTLTGETSGTTFTFQSEGYDDTNNFVDWVFIKDNTKENIIDKPEVINDILIGRQSLSVFQNIFRLKDIDSLGTLITYAGGGVFNIVENS